LHRNKKEKWVEDKDKKIGMIFKTFYDGLPSSGSLSECQLAIGRRGDASISDQWRNSVPAALQPKTTLPIGSDVPIRS
jgi:hypothetical protein